MPLAPSNLASATYPAPRRRRAGRGQYRSHWERGCAGCWHASSVPAARRVGATGISSGVRLWRHQLADIPRDPGNRCGADWLTNGEESEYFNHKDVVFECFHNFVAFSQWGNTLYNIMAKLGRDTGAGQAKDWFTKTMATDYDNPDGSAFPPLERFVMELFRTISPNAEVSRR